MSPPLDATSRLRGGLTDLGWSVADLWLGTVGIGGRLSLSEVGTIMERRGGPEPREYDLLAAAMNECFHERGLDHPLPYWGDMPG
jgi:hypothetical protein